MKLLKQLIIDRKAVDIIDEDVRLRLSGVGGAKFTVVGNEPLSGLVVFLLGYAGSTQHVFFAGRVENSEVLGNDRVVVWVKEIVSRLDHPVTISLRHCSMRDVLIELGKQTGLGFKVPDRDYTRVLRGQFFSNSNGHYCIKQLQETFGITDLIYQQEGNGEVFVGGWEDSYWFGRDLDVHQALEKKRTGLGLVRYPAIPSLRPGAFLNGRYVTEVTFKDLEMVVRCANQLND
jgi:hypothetical protein